MNKYYYDVNDVMSIADLKEGTAYRVMRIINEELKAKGFITFRGKVPKAALFEKLGIQEQGGADE